MIADVILAAGALAILLPVFLFVLVRFFDEVLR